MKRNYILIFLLFFVNKSLFALGANDFKKHGFNVLSKSVAIETLSLLMKNEGLMNKEELGKILEKNDPRIDEYGVLDNTLQLKVRKDAEILKHYAKVATFPYTPLVFLTFDISFIDELYEKEIDSHLSDSWMFGDFEDDHSIKIKDSDVLKLGALLQNSENSEHIANFNGPEYSNELVVFSPKISLQYLTAIYIHRGFYNTLSFNIKDFFKDKFVVLE